MDLNSLKLLNDAFCFLFEAVMPFCLMSMMPKRKLARETGFSLNLYLFVNSSVTCFSTGLRVSSTHPRLRVGGLTRNLWYPAFDRVVIFQ